ncbi:MAG: hypothetical protein BWZ06_01571 [Bacteroidetes bacterium ADurb.BinA261]|nr:MAG: hypothetical protein BWZ06_01571 [Bacteroidetes bacterium ADurb.BinA261]
MAGYECIGIAGINARKKRIDCIINERFSQSPRCKRTDRFVGIGSFGAPRFAQDAKFVRKCKKRCGDSTPQPAWKIMKFSVFPNPSAFGFFGSIFNLALIRKQIVKVHQFFGHAGTGIWAGFESKSIFVIGANLSAGTIRLLENRKRNASSLQCHARRKSRESGTDDGYIFFHVLLYRF